MCKILVVPHVGKKFRKAATQFMLKAVKPMSETDGDGLGYMAITDDNRLVGEKWRYNKQSFKMRDRLSLEELKLFKKYRGMVTAPEDQYRCYGGEYDSGDLKSWCLHTRFATCGKSIQNTHPFFTETSALIHNGVINNPTKLKQSTCDSEHILNEYIDHGVANDVKKIQKVANELTGYFACAVYAKTDYDEWILDVFKDQGATVFGVFVEQLGTMVFCTSGALVQGICKTLRWKCSRAFQVLDNVLNRFDVDTGDVIDTQEFKKVYRVPAASVTTYGSTGNGHFNRGHLFNSGWDSFESKRSVGTDIEEEKAEMAVDKYIETLDD